MGGYVKTASRAEAMIKNAAEFLGKNLEYFKRSPEEETNIVLRTLINSLEKMAMNDISIFTILQKNGWEQGLIIEAIKAAEWENWRIFSVLVNTKCFVAIDTSKELPPSRRITAEEIIRVLEP
jgi:hypothetical protein